jgi:hypothetical protein
MKTYEAVEVEFNKTVLNEAKGQTSGPDISYSGQKPTTHTGYVVGQSPQPVWTRMEKPLFRHRLNEAYGLNKGL